MGNHNVLITNPKGGRRYQFPETVSLDVCRDFLIEFGPAPIGWHYQIVNLNKRKKKNPEYVLIQGFDEDNTLVDQRKTRVRHNNGRWYTPRMAKRDARKQGAIWFTREKVFKEEGDTLGTK